MSSTRTIDNVQALTLAADLADEIRREAQRMCALSWALDSALSLRRKAEPSTGYRSTEGLGDAPWNPADYDRKIIDAVSAAWPTVLRVRLDLTLRQTLAFATAALREPGFTPEQRAAVAKACDKALG